jgi:hypothetical protein
MNLLTIIYMIITAPIFLIGCIVSFIGSCIDGVGVLLMYVWEVDQ